MKSAEVLANYIKSEAHLGERFVVAICGFGGRLRDHIKRNGVRITGRDTGHGMLHTGHGIRVRGFDVKD